LVDESGRRDGRWDRSAADAPEIDGVVHIEDGSTLKPGDLAQVKVLRSDAHDLWRVAQRPGAAPHEIERFFMAQREVVVTARRAHRDRRLRRLAQGHSADETRRVAIKEAVARAEIDPATIGHVVLGSVIHGEARDMYIARVAAIEAGCRSARPA